MKKYLTPLLAFLFLISINGFATNPHIKIYFNHPVDTTRSSGTKAVYLNGTMDDTLVAYINRAKYTLDVAVYNYIQSSQIANIATAINAAYSRGVRVRWISNGSSSNSGLSAINSGINKVASPTTSGFGIMHNKFMVVDANSSNANDPIVWTGSSNWDDQQFLHDYNNAIIIQDKPLAQAYRAEFNQMWGDTGLTPDSINAKFGPNKLDITTHSFTIDGHRVESYFSPSDQTESKIVAATNTADKELFFGIYTFTSSNIANAIVGRIQNQHVAARGIEDQFSQSYSPYSTLSPVMLTNFQVYNGGQYLYHNKMMIIDADYASSDPQVVTGSHNWSSSANTKNDENTLIVHDPLTANIYTQSFWRNFLDMNPSGVYPTITAINETADETELSLYPNPSNGTVFLLSSKEVNVEVVNILGEKVLGFNRVDANSLLPINLDEVGKGMYLVRITSGANTVVKRVSIQ